MSWKRTQSIAPPATVLCARTTEYFALFWSCGIGHDAISAPVLPEPAERTCSVYAVGDIPMKSVAVPYATVASGVVPGVAPVETMYRSTLPSCGEPCTKRT